MRKVYVDNSLILSFATIKYMEICYKKINFIKLNQTVCGSNSQLREMQANVDTLLYHNCIKLTVELE